MIKKLLFLATLSLCALTSCAHYTTADGLSKIHLESESTLETKLPSSEEETPTQEQLLREKIKAQEKTIRALNAQIAELTSGSKEAPKLPSSSVLPPLSSITYPTIWNTASALTTAPEEKVTVLLLPLGEKAMDEETIKAVAQSVSDIKAQIIIATGEKSNTYLLVSLLNRSAILQESGAIITDYAPVSSSERAAIVKLDDTRTLRITQSDIPQGEALEAFRNGEDWKTLVETKKTDRLQVIDSALADDTLSQSAIYGASLYEPASSDWSTFSPVTYRQIDYAWPLADAIINKGYYDTYRQTHFSEATDAGNTLTVGEMNERTDYLFAKKILPLSSAVVGLGPESVEKDGYARFGVVAEYLIP